MRGSNIAGKFRRCAGFVILACAFLASLPSGAANARSQPERLSEWHKGPVRYLMNRSETRLYRRLKTREARLAFIRRFWSRRDPSPRTPQNERRLVFWRRVAEANRKFGDGAKPGWRTDRGKIYILLGPPDDIEERGNYNTGIATASRGLLRWHYEGLRQAADPAHTIIAFTSEGHNDWYLTSDPRLSSIYFSPDSATQEPFGIGPALERLVTRLPYGGGTLGTAMDLGRLQEVPSERELLKAVVRAEDFVGSYHGATTSTVLATSSGKPLLVLTLALPKSDLQPVFDGHASGMLQRFAASAQLRAAGDENSLTVIDFPENAFAAEPNPLPGDPWLRFQAIRAVPAGNWALSGIILDRQGGGASTHYGTIKVPATPSTAPVISGPFLAREIRRAGGAARGSRPFRIGDFIVVPRMDATIKTNERFALFVEILPAPGDPGAVALDWQFFAAEASGEAFTPIARTGHLDDARGPRAWDTPASKFAPGRYRLRFVARAPGGKSTEREISFEILASAEGDGSAHAAKDAGKGS